MNAKVSNMVGNSGPVRNQFVIEEAGQGALGNFVKRSTFQSYDSIIAVITVWPDGTRDVALDAYAWDYSKTTGKYRNRFLGESKADTERKIKSGEYTLANLN